MNRPSFSSTQSGFRPREFSRAIGISLRSLYDLPPDRQPRSVKLGGARVIIETPFQYLTRMAELESQQKPLPQAA